MKKLLFVLLIFITHFTMAQDLDKIWKEIDQSFQKGELKSVHEKVNQAINLAREQGNTPLLAKGLFYSARISLATSDETDDINPIFEVFEKEKAQAESPISLIFDVYRAKLYQQYLSENSYKISGRTELENQSQSDIRFWTKADFERKIKELYTDALSHTTELLNEPTRNWEDIFVPLLQKENFEKNISVTPTLFDVFGHYYINFLKSINEETTEHLDKLAELNRLKGEKNAYLYNKALAYNLDKDKLSTLVKEFPEADYNPDLYYILAKAYYDEGKSQKKVDSFHQVFASEKEVSGLYPKSDALVSIGRLSQEIRAKSFSFEIEKYLLTEKNTPFKISHRNLEKLYVKVIDYNIGLKDILFSEAKNQMNSTYKDSEERYYNFLKSHKTVKSFSIDLKHFDDFMEHSSLFKMEPLPEGRYIIMLSEFEDFKFIKGQEIQYSEVFVSDTALEFDGKENFLVLNRETGQPVSKQKIEIYTTTYGRELEFLTTIQTYTKGFAQLKSPRQMIYRLADSPVFYGQNLYFYGSSGEIQERESTSTKIFTDRAIYRPGQTVYFKGIVTSTFQKDVKVIPNTAIRFTLRDANGKEVQTLDLTTNEFGSANGEFVLPSSGLTGYFTIQSSKNGYYPFRVEEYKRPTFKVEINKPDEIYLPNDSVKITGKAETFSGANLSNAKVTYRVYRQPVYIYRVWGFYPNYEPEEQMAFGTTESDDQGNFSLQFKAIPTRDRLDDKDFRTYRYRIDTEITDINGETHSGTQTVLIGDRQLNLYTDIGSQINVADLSSFFVYSENLNGKPVHAKGEIRISPLKSPERTIRPSAFTTDYQYYSKEEFVKLFPNEAYGNEDKPETRESLPVKFSSAFDTEKNSEITLKNPNSWQEGYYKVEIISEGEVFNTQLIYVINPKKSAKAQKLFSYSQNKSSFEPGETASVAFQSSDENLYVNLRIEADGKLLKNDWVNLKDEGYTLEIPIKESYRGGIWVHYIYARFNDFGQGSINLAIPYSHKVLEVKTEVSRNKLTPGDTEKWKVTVSGANKDKILAEVLATMYDASLDQFASNNFIFSPYRFYNSARLGWGYQRSAFRIAQITSFHGDYVYFDNGYSYNLPDLNLYGFNFYSGRNFMMMKSMRQEMAMEESVALPAPMASAQGGADMGGGEAGDEATPIEENLDNIQARKSLEETAFFYPTLKTDTGGNVSFEFTVPESLTEWKILTFAHTPDLKTGTQELRVKTQKDLMVVPNVPRFLREGDQLIVSSKITNLSDKTLSGKARLFLWDAISEQPLDQLFSNVNAVKDFNVNAGVSGEVSWDIKVPANIGAVSYKIVASADSFSDGEESVLPVLTNRMPVTETLPIYIRENQEKEFKLDKLIENNSPTLENFKLTFDLTSNPIWYAIFSLPYLREYSFESSTQTFYRLYANLISQNIIQSNPKIKAVFDDWNSKGQLQSKLELNQELKNIILEETPWLRDAEREEDRMKRIAVLFDLNKMQHELGTAIDKLNQKQKPSGGFSWFDGGRENTFITTSIVSGFGQLKKMNLKAPGTDAMLSKAIKYMDQKQLEYYLVQKNRKKPSYEWYTGIHYMYARSFFLDEYPIPQSLDTLKDNYLKNIRKSKPDFPLQTQAMAAMVLNRYGEKEVAKALIHSIREHSVESDEMGMYWKSNTPGWFWYQAPIETQTSLIEAFDEISDDTEAVEAMKVWLLKNRQTNQWHSPSATANAVFALMNTGKDWLNVSGGIHAKVGNNHLDLSESQSGSGYVKTGWNKNEIRPEMGKIEIEKTTPGVAWGALYWQYFEDLDKITSAETGIGFNKKLYLKKATDSGLKLIEITEDMAIHIGDKVTVRLEISIDRDMEFVHIKDMRASGFEPVNTLSGYRWRGEFGYYESTRDVATHFFADFMQKGTYVFEYDLRAGQKGDFSNGITQMQNMYAPELSAQSEGQRIEIK